MIVQRKRRLSINMLMVALMLAVHILGRVSHLNKDLPLGMAATNATTQQR